MSPGAVEDDGGSVVGPGRVLGGGECSEPLAGPLTWLADLGDPFAPAPLPHAAVAKLVVVRATFALALSIAAVVVFGFCCRCGCGCGSGSWGGGGFSTAFVVVFALGKVRWGCVVFIHRVKVW